MSKHLARARDTQGIGQFGGVLAALGNHFAQRTLAYCSWRCAWRCSWPGKTSRTPGRLSADLSTVCAWAWERSGELSLGRWVHLARSQLTRPPASQAHKVSEKGDSQARRERQSRRETAWRTSTCTRGRQHGAPRHVHAVALSSLLCSRKAQWKFSVSWRSPHSATTAVTASAAAPFERPAAARSASLAFCSCERRVFASFSRSRVLTGGDRRERQGVQAGRVAS